MTKRSWKPIHSLKKIAKDRTMFLGIFLVGAVVFTAIFAPFISPHDPYDQNTTIRLAPPGKVNFFGTDNYGRDVLSRIIWGSRISLMIGLNAVAFGGLIGGLLGLAAGYFKGWTDTVVSWLTDVLMSFPTEVLAIIVIVALGANSITAMIAIGVVFVPRYIRLVRGSALSLSENTYVEASRSVGQSSIKIMFMHIFPNLLGETLVMTSLWIATAIRIEAVLGFLGLGAQPPEPSWGVMSKEGLDAMFMAPWLSIIPGLAIFVTAMGFNLLGDSFRDALDPKLEN